MALPAASGVMELTGTTANVAGAPDEFRIEILRWSTDQERAGFQGAWDLTAIPADPNGGGGRGKGKGKGGDEPEQVAPEVALARALQQAPTVGYVWTSEIAGYAVRYAGKVDRPDGSQRVILITQRPLGETNTLWAPVAGTPNSLKFSVIELRLDSNGRGEGKASLTGGLAADAESGIVSLQDYGSAAVVLANVSPAD